jgi:hypothetical protein
MVRRPTAVLTRSRRPGPGTLALGTPLAAVAYFLAAPVLPALPDGDATMLVAGGVGMLVVAASALALLPAQGTLVGPLLIVLGAALLVAALNAAGVGAAANAPEALLAGAIGLLFARWLATPVIAVAVPIFVAAIDIWSVASGPTSQMVDSGTDGTDPLTFDMPAWGHAGSAGQLGLSDALFLAMFAAWAWHYGFRRTATVVGLLLGLVGSVALGELLDRTIPALPLLAAGYLLPNLDRIPALLRHADAQ